MSNAVLWFGSLPAIMGVAVFVLGCYFAFRRHKKGVLKIKLPAIGELSTETLSLAFIVLAVPFLLTAHHVYVKERELTAAEQLARQTTSLVNYARLMPPQERAPLFKSIAKSMQNDVALIGRTSGAESIAALDRMEAAAKLVLTIDPENGHGVYFLGEAFRLRHAADSEVRFHGQFRRYVSLACKKSKESFTAKTTANACYDSGDGYCAERIAWVLHLLANSHYRDAQRTTDPVSRQASLQTAARDADAALKVWGQPFVHTEKSEQLTTTVIQDRTKVALKEATPFDPLCR